MHELDPKEIKRQRRWVKVFLTIALISGALALLQAVHLHFDPMAERHYGRLVHVRIADRDFAIPSEYFRGPVPHGQTTTLYMWLMMPDYTPYRGEIAGDRDQIREAWKRHIVVFVDDVSSTPSLQFKYNAFRNGPLNIFKPQDVANAYGLHRTLVWKQNPRGQGPFINTDLYYENDKGGNIGTFVACDRDSPEEERLTPVCSFHVFQDGPLLYRLSYGKSNLPRWRDIQTRVYDLIGSFSCVPRSGANQGNIHKGEKICPL